MPVNTFKRKDYGVWDVWRQSYSRRELLARRRQLAKAANSRIRRLESAKSEITGESIFQQHHYSTIRIELRRQKRRRFSEGKGYGGSDNDLRAEISMLEKFLATQTSTVGGARRVERSRMQALIEKGISTETASNPEFYKFLNSSTFNELTYEYLDSEDVLDIYSRASDNGLSAKEIERMFEDHMKKKRPSRQDIYKELDRLLGR